MGSGPSVGERLGDYWRSSRTMVANPGATTQEIASFEARYNLATPQDLLDYLGTVNGMGTNDTDEELFRFWPVQEVSTVSKCAPEYLCSPDLRRPETLFGFADWLIFSLVYLIRISPTDQDDGHV
jgi:hypothetical protein